MQLRQSDSLADLLADTVKQYKRSLDIAQNQYNAGTAAKSDVITAQALELAVVKFAKEVDNQTFESIGLKVGKEAARGYRPGKKYAQHPYTEATVDGVKVNIVPCYEREAWGVEERRGQVPLPRRVREGET